MIKRRTYVHEIFPPFQTKAGTKGSQNRYSGLAAKTNLSYPLWGALSQSVYTVAVPLMADVLTFSPSSRVLVSVKNHPEASLNQNVLFPNLRRDKDEMAYGGTVWEYIAMSTQKPRGKKELNRFSLDMIC